MVSRSSIPPTAALVALSMACAPCASVQALTIYDYTSGPISSVQALGSQSGQPPLGEDIYGIIVLSQPVPTNGTSTVHPSSAVFGINNFGIFTPDNLTGPITLTTVDGTVTDFSFQLAAPPSPSGTYSVDASSAANTAVAESEGGGFEAFAPAGEWYQPPPPPPGYSCFNIVTATGCEADNPSCSGCGSIDYSFYAPPPSTSTVPEIDPASAAGALTLLLGLLAIGSGERMRRRRRT